MSPPIETHPGTDVRNYCGLTYAQFLVFPRVILSAMPREWQEKFVALLEELDETFDYFPSGKNIYYVRVGPSQSMDDADKDGNLPPLRLKAPENGLCNYRRPSAAFLDGRRKKKETA